MQTTAAEPLVQSLSRSIKINAPAAKDPRPKAQALDSAPDWQMFLLVTLIETAGDIRGKLCLMQALNKVNLFHILLTHVFVVYMPHQNTLLQ